MTQGRPSRFPDPRTGPGDAPLAVGGDCAPATLLDAYAHGIFPWPADERTLLWWSPDPRAVIPLDGLHVSRSLRRTLRSQRFSCSVDAAFGQVVAGCAHRPGQGTWITAELAGGYRRLHGLGHAHSVEVWDRSGRLVGGVYGVAMGAAFMGESMFHRAADASKVALVHLVERLRAGGFVLLDAQLPTSHLASLGAIEMARSQFLDRLAEALRLPARFSDD
ncbi:MAG: leucyl/phenylalanyl-tRNA--protein transferase [Actinomycetota bacterium]|nr:leucyl/phenylalanyl-tRNA--protein transferase [Actinomycetota bacterium]